MTSNDRSPSGGSAARALSLEVRPDGVAIITYDVPGEPINTLKPSFVEEFDRAVAEVTANSAIKAAILVSGKPQGFIAGADLEVIQAVTTASQGEAMSASGQAAMAKLAACPKPIVAAIHGAALGGGFEVALACHGRVLSDHAKTSLALPEVQLGLLPGMDGVQRLAALAGLQVAMEYGLTGKAMRAARARSLRVADDVVPVSLLRETAAALALSLAAKGPPFAAREKKKITLQAWTIAALEKNPLGRALLFRKARRELRKKTGGHYPAPERILDILEIYAKRGLEASRADTAKCFGELTVSAVAHRLIEIFFATTAMKKDIGTDPPDVRPRVVETIGVLGAGLMGAGIAAVSVSGGLSVRLKDKDGASLGRGVTHVAEILGERVAKKHLTSQERDQQFARLTMAADDAGMERVDLVIEAVFEDLALKQRVLAEFEAVAGENAIFASNTSSIPLATIAAASKRPENVVGMHYMSPVEKMPLLEVVAAPRTSPEVVATAVALGKRQGKTVIVVADSPGFYTSRILAPYINEAGYLLAQGASVEQIDGALVAWGFPVGPLALLDEVGIDVAAHVGSILREAFGDRLAPPPIIAELIASGRKGRKNERGIYLYGPSSKTEARGRRVDETVYDVLHLPRPAHGKKGPVPREEIQMRASLQFVNEAFHALGEGVLRSPRDGDIGALLGLGFPPFRGGPFRYVDAASAAEILKRIEGYAARFGPRWRPAPALVELAKSGKKVYA